MFQPGLSTSVTLHGLQADAKTASESICHVIKHDMHGNNLAL